MALVTDVVIPVHNSVHWLAWCLDELYRYESNDIGSVYVVDDRSDGSQAIKLKEIVGRFPNARLIVNSANHGGFGYACNLGASFCTSTSILFLNTDCLLTEGVVKKLLSTFVWDERVVLACPISNNSPDLSFPMFAGRSYLDMAEIIRLATDGVEQEKLIREACTVVGNCLMVRKSFFDDVGGFSSEWGIGYGEETDMHMKALSMGLRGVVHVGCYVYHHGGGTFNNQKEIESHRQKNYKLFISKWGNQYKQLASKVSNLDSLDYLSNLIDVSSIKSSSQIELDALFYLPGIDQSVGGMHAVVAICNDMIRKGLKVSCALVGINADVGLKSYKEPILFNFFYFASNDDFLCDKKILAKVVFSTIYSSSKIVSEYCIPRNSSHVQFIQGYEGYFDNGEAYCNAINSYTFSKKIVTTSNWLCGMIGRHLNDSHEVQRLPLIVNKDIFFSSTLPRKFDVGIVLRGSPDKGQWLLIEALDRLVNEGGKRVIVFCSSKYSAIKDRYLNKVEFVDLPVDQYTMANYLREIKLFYDSSLHEGFGLMPFEAALCGCKVVSSDSGGVRDFIHPLGGTLVTINPDPSMVVDLINQQLNEPQKNNLVAAIEEINGNGFWYEYISNLKNNSFPIVPNIGHFGLYKKSVATIKIAKRSSFGKLIKVYKMVMPFIPRRIHFALKIIILGHF